LQQVVHERALKIKLPPWAELAFNASCLAGVNGWVRFQYGSAHRAGGGLRP